FVYFLDPISMEMLTFSTSSGGGRSAVINLADQIKRMRELGRPHALPVVELAAEKMPTKFGLKSKPLFKIVKWYDGGSENGGGPKEIAPPISQGRDERRHSVQSLTRGPFGGGSPGGL